MERSADASGVRLDIPDAQGPEPDDGRYPTTDYQRPADNSYKPHSHQPQYTNQAYDVDDNADDDRLAGYNSDHHFIPIGGNLNFCPPQNDSGGQEFEDRRQPDFPRGDKFGGSRDNLNSSRGRISPYNPVSSNQHGPTSYCPPEPASHHNADDNPRDVKNYDTRASPQAPNVYNPSSFPDSNVPGPPQEDREHSKRAKAGADDRDRLNQSADSEADLKLRQEWAERLQGTRNEAYEYDADADSSDQSFHGGDAHFSSVPMGDYAGEYQDWPRFQDVDLGDENDSVTGRNSVQTRSAFPVLDRPVSGRYLKNPSLERKKQPHHAPGPYDPHLGMYIAPPIITKTAEVPSTNSKVRKRIPQPPSKLQLRCACAWSCIACLAGAFICAIPALRYVVTASESRKIHDYNSSRSYLRKAWILCFVSLAVGAGAWITIILYLNGSFR